MSGRAHAVDGDGADGGGVGAWAQAARAWLTPRRARAIRDGLVVGGIVFNLVLVFVWGPQLILWVDVPSWRSIDLSNLYGIAETSLTATGAFRFAPAIAWLMYPLSILPWSAFFVAFLGLDLAAVAILGRRWTPLLIVAFPPVLLELVNGNIHLFMALAIYVGMRWPGTWAFLLLTKVTPGVGVAWFAARREWRNLAIALGTTSAIVGVGFAIAPGQWIEWVRSLGISAGVAATSTFPPLLIRVPIAAAIAWYAGRTDRAWLVPFACLAAMPTIWLQSTALLTACFPLWWERRRWEREAPVGVPA